jgi:hypothetical protein
MVLEHPAVVVVLLVLAETHPAAPLALEVTVLALTVRLRQQPASAYSTQARGIFPAVALVSRWGRIRSRPSMAATLLALLARQTLGRVRAVMEVLLGEAAL